MKKIVLILIFVTTVFTTIGLQAGLCFSCEQKTLDLSKYETTNEELQEILKERGSKLETIDLSGQTNLNFELIGTYCQKLKNLYLASTDINNEMLTKILANTPNLTNLSLSECFILSNIGIIITKHCAHLEWLNISCTNTTKADIEILQKTYASPYKPFTLLTNGCTNLQY